MFKFSSIITVFIVVLLVSGSLLAQNPGKVKATISDMPDQMEAGKSAKVTVTITNTGKTTWSNENIYSHELSVFEITKEWSGEWKLEPGQSKELQYTVTAPDRSGSFKMRIVIYDGNRKIGYRSKKVEVVSLTGK